MQVNVSSEARDVVMITGSHSEQRDIACFHYLQLHSFSIEHTGSRNHVVSLFRSKEKDCMKTIVFILWDRLILQTMSLPLRLPGEGWASQPRWVFIVVPEGIISISLLNLKEYDIHFHYFSVMTILIPPQS